MRFHNDDSNIPDLCIKLIQPPEPTLSDFPAYEKSNKTPSDLCSIAARYENTAPKMSAWIVGFYQKKLLKLIEFGSLSAPVRQETFSSQPRQAAKEIPILSKLGFVMLCLCTKPWLKVTIDERSNSHQLRILL
jgi:hypothetical protein